MDLVIPNTTNKILDFTAYDFVIMKLIEHKSTIIDYTARMRARRIAYLHIFSNQRTFPLIVQRILPIANGNLRTI